MATAARTTVRRPVQKMTWTATTQEDSELTHHQKHVLAHGLPSSLSLSCCCLVNAHLSEGCPASLTCSACAVGASRA